MEIISYNRSDDVVIKFLDEYGVVKHTTYQSFKNGSIRNPYDKTVYGIGYIGEGEYKVYIDQERLEPRYNVWRTLLGRCCTEKHRDRFKAYSECKVCDEWLNYQTFSKWYEENIYYVYGERMHIDKDILIPGNKIYSPKTCIIVPQSINMIFVNPTRTKDADLPTGIKRYYSIDSNYKYSVIYNGKYLGVYELLDDALNIYNEHKANHLKEVTERYKDVMPQKIYEILMNWKPAL